MGLIYFYQYCISPFLPKMCRFTPTCSQYAKRALSEYGILKGSLLSIYRILRCNPFNKNTGFDPVVDNIKGEIKWVL